MTDPTERRQPSGLLVLIPVLITAVGLVIFQIQRDDSAPDPIRISATSPTYDSLQTLTEASDLVAIGTITEAEPGRTISDPSNPDAAIRTSLFVLRLETVLRGPDVDRAVIEHETALADNTPIIINGIQPPTVGERGLFFLVAGRSPDFPHYAFTNDQGRYLLDGDRLTALGQDRLSSELSTLSVGELTELLLDQ